MRLVPVKSLRMESNIAVDIINNNGKLLLKEGQKITQKGIEILKNLNISHVYIRDKYCFNTNKGKYTAKINNFYKTIRQLEKLASKRMIGKANSFDLQKIMYIATQFVNDVLSQKDDLKISYEPNKLSVNPFMEQTIYVSIMAVILGVKMNLHKDKLIKLCVASLLKDIGLLSHNVKIPYNVVSIQHPILGYKYLKEEYEIDEEILEAILHHHERFDGSGYPYKLRGEEINLLARIIGIVETFYKIKTSHTILSDSHDELKMKLKKIFVKFDMNILECFFKNVEIFTLDTMLILNNGDIGVVIKNSYKDPFKPCVKIVKSSYNLEGEIIDLFDNQDLNIENLMYYVD